MNGKRDYYEVLGANRGTSEEEIKKAKATQLDLGGALAGIEKRIEAADRSLRTFRDLQTKLGIPAYELSKAKDEVKTKLAEIQNELNRDLFAFFLLAFRSQS